MEKTKGLRLGVSEVYMIYIIYIIQWYFDFNQFGILEVSNSKNVGDYQPLIKRSLTTTLHPKNLTETPKVTKKLKGNAIR